MNCELLTMLIAQQLLIQKHEEAFNVLNQAFNKALDNNLKLIKAYDELFAKHMKLMDQVDELRKR